MANEGVVKIKLNDIKVENKKFEVGNVEQQSKFIEKFYKTKQKLNFETGQANHGLINVDYSPNAFLCAVLTAYNNHLPLEISPDDIWCMIALGIAKHLGGDADMAETYRKVFVNHQGKMKLAVEVDNLNEIFKDPKAKKELWPTVVDKLSDQIKANTKREIGEIMEAQFTTTGPTERTVFQCMLMETMKNYFRYNMGNTLCGIPEVYIHGGPEDWQNILQRLEGLKEIFSTIRNYLDRVAIYVQKILDSVNGNPHLKFWNSMVREGGESGSRYLHPLTGWIVGFTEYGDKRLPTHWIGNELEGYLPWYCLDSEEKENLDVPAVALTEFELVNNSEKHKMKLASGFLGVSQDESTFAVRPVMGWITYSIGK